MSLKAKVDKLPQAILARAFRRELVPQSENDEPAEVLLERIRREREGKDAKKACPVTRKKNGKSYQIKEPELPQAAEERGKYGKV